MIRGVSKTLSYLVRPFGVDFPPATHEEANEIAEPAARMIDKNPKVGRIIRQISDPVVLIGAVVAFFAVRTIMKHQQEKRLHAVPPRPPAPPTSQQPVPPAAATAPAATIGAPPPPPPEVAFREQILGSIAANGFGQFG